jgi:hypothetical protein
VYVTVADLALTSASNIVETSDKNVNSRGQINKQSNAATVGQKRPLAAGAAGAADGNQKKKKTSSVASASTGTSQSNPSSSAPAAVTPAVKGVPTKERKPLLMQKSQVRTPYLECHIITLPQ